jgi:hypothetical protein
MTNPPDFHELVGEDLPAAERERLRRVHDLLVAAGPPPEVPPSLAHPDADRSEGVLAVMPRRRAGAVLALAAALALAAFVGGYVAGVRHDRFHALATVAMHAARGADPAASALIRIGAADAHGNRPLELVTRSLAPLPNGGYYEMYLTRGKKWWTCGTFAAGAGQVTVRLTVPYEFRRGDGWVVTAEQPGARASGRVVLTT